jgi:hypothetical protein
LNVIAVVQVIIVFGWLLALTYLFVANRRTRQSLHDLVAGTFVVPKEEAGLPFRDHIWRGHFAILTMLIVVLIAGSVAVTESGVLSGTQLASELDDTLKIQRAVNDEPHVMVTSVGDNTTTFYTLKQGTTTTTTLQVTVRIDFVPSDPEAFARKVAETVLKTAPTAMGCQNLAIGVRYGYAIGIMSSWNTKQYVHSPDEWRGQFQQDVGGTT